ncbi:ATP-dependent helicase, partial [Candidatus Saccharibacteria bacterium]|nr:ATP-dependent helicase [Candidatus Saccharibacteria bacterium]
MKPEQTFSKEYDRLNTAQKAAVDQTDGTVLVVAGPGTGKTQLLAMRVANILRQTDADARDILCLTFTESAAANMTERLVRIIGPEAYKVAVHTFHSFGSEIISRWPEYFYNGALFRPSDELATAEILREILSGLPHSNPLSVTMNGEFTYLSDVQRTISNFRNAGLSPSEIKQILQHNLKFAAAILPDFRKVFENRVDKKTVILAEELLKIAERLDKEFEDFPFAPEPSLAQIFTQSLKKSLEEVAENSGKTTPLSNFKKNWATLDAVKNLILKDARNSEKLLAAAEVYEAYEKELEKSNLYDFDDMILRVTAAIEQNPDLKFDLQERYQYILVDEFQDTNGAQMRLLTTLTDYDATPNLMVVGDDDQAIYRFQGADISNIQQFMGRYPTAAVITLTENYRSMSEILTSAEAVSAQISERLANSENIEKTLRQNVVGKGKTERIIAETREQENAGIARKVTEISTKNPVSSIAIIARTHADLEQLLPYLTAQNIAFDYERRQSVLNSPPVEQLILLAQVIDAISTRNDSEVDALLPQLLSFPAWQIQPIDIWKLSLAAKKARKYWLEQMLLYSEQTRQIAEWLIIMSARSQNEPLEPILDELFGTPSFSGQEKPLGKTLILSENMKITAKEISKTLSARENDFTSPLFNYFFGKEKMESNATEYLDFLAALSMLRTKLRSWRPDQKLALADFLDFVNAAEDFHLPLTIARQNSSSNQVKLLTAHKAKGLEFDVVFIINATSQRWGAKSRSPADKLPAPHNLHLRVSGNNDDERLRLLFVAMTRARETLIISSAASDSEKTSLPIEYLLDVKEKVLPSSDLATSITEQKLAWHAPLTTPSSDLRTALADTLAKYKLSATHLNNFLDISRGGPETFLLKNLLHFPEAKSPAAAFGSSIHIALQRAHTHFTARGDLKPLEDVLGDFVDALDDADLSQRDRDFYLKKGLDALTIFYEQRKQTFAPTQRAEYNFTGENIILEGIRLSGKIDLI